MRGGDVMYIPFGTVHHVASASELSSHLTVNVERQACLVAGAALRGSGGRVSGMRVHLSQLLTTRGICRWRSLSHTHLDCASLSCSSIHGRCCCAQPSQSCSWISASDLSSHRHDRPLHPLPTGSLLVSLQVAQCPRWP